ncbi:LAME_0C01442g1_1 [Lachancea meyersii CBS 8951]|uniref:LAME_0C01442g1_1 n=1 Tax=Lachancea meyersii CBS 8951 TaxID=1266667 RepID=A0A1G4IZG5_9SACH|nr:LAME_0C01442g1_1 [Lachancea meyersii CBS 8951]
MADSDVPTECSTPRRYVQEDTDRQILKWAGKLELETIDLRDKSSKLFQVLEANSELLKRSHEKVGLAAAGFSDIKDAQKQLTSALDFLERFEKAQMADRASSESSQKQLTELLVKHAVTRTTEIQSLARTTQSGLDQIQETFGKQLQSYRSEQSEQYIKVVSGAEKAFSNLLGQAVTASQVLTSISSETSRLSEHLVFLENQVRELRAEVSELQGLRSDVSALCDLKTEIAALQELRAEMTILKDLKTEMVALRDPEMGLGALSHLKTQIEELRDLKSEVGGLHDLKTGMSALQELVISALREKELNLQQPMVPIQSRDKVSKPVPSASTSSREQQRRKRTQNTAGTRWIIPWDEISDVDSATLMSSEL